MSGLSPPSNVEAEHKAHILILQTLVSAIVRTLPPEQRTAAMVQWDIELAAMKNVVLHSRSPDEFVDLFDRYVETFRKQRLFSPAQSEKP